MTFASQLALAQSAIATGYACVMFMSEENVSGDWQLRPASSDVVGTMHGACPERHIKVLAAIVANYSLTSSISFVSKRATYVYRAILNRLRQRIATEAKIRTSFARTSIENRAASFEVVKFVL